MAETNRGNKRCSECGGHMPFRQSSGQVGYRINTYQCEICEHIEKVTSLPHERFQELRDYEKKYYRIMDVIDGRR